MTPQFGDIVVITARQDGERWVLAPSGSFSHNDVPNVRLLRPRGDGVNHSHIVSITEVTVVERPTYAVEDRVVDNCGYVGTIIALHPDAFTRIGTNLMALVGTMSAGTGATSVLAEGLILVADNLDKIFKAAGVAGAALLTAFAPAILGAMATGLTAIGTAGVAALNAIRLAVLANPLGALATALVTITTGLYLFRDEIYNVLGVDVIKEVQNVANRIIGFFVGAYALVTEAWSNLPAFFSTMGKEAWNATHRAHLPAARCYTYRVFARKPARIGHWPTAPERSS